MKTMQWSDAARSPRDVAAAVEEAGEVRLERRGGEVAFVITRADRALQVRGGLDVAARLLRSLVGDQIEVIERALEDALPWSKFLPDKDRRAFAEEFAWTLRACTDLAVWGPFDRMLHEWQQTAAIHADPFLAKELSRALDSDLGPVLPPMLGDSGAEAE